ncbi:hypothetical protein, partial [Fictibacillus macauensis]|uniref:hypothetical protein n=1 Tax=Fictibacillus macauensis TaxID=245160 RepID=UPI00058E4B95
MTKACAAFAAFDFLPGVKAARKLAGIGRAFGTRGIKTAVKADFKQSMTSIKTLAGNAADFGKQRVKQLGDLAKGGSKAHEI